ncbi:hypothetical protein O181_116042 [Austropuccinia psidii MF-1]|uniref:Retrotransposon gag domain-containing protein n=1 Tax=Austropuccinia psidii MF-1 TaxID=1389203 RepID=A0A9Q3K8M3_9BASI|nr:hypothetical protein [Austropuccinia psidii MF-1]
MSEGERARLGEVEEVEGEDSVEEEDSGETEVADALANAAESPQDHGANGYYYGTTFSSSSPQGQLQSPCIQDSINEAPDSFDATQAHKLRWFIQSCKFIFHNDPENFISDRKKLLYSALFLTGRAGKLIESYLSNISNEDPSYLLINWHLLEAQLLTLFGDPNEVRGAEQELDNLRMKESGHVSLYIADFRSLMSIIGDLGERAYIHVYRRSLASRPLDQLASYPGNFDTFQELMDITLELDTRYHEKQKEKGSLQENKPSVTGSNFSRHPQDSSSKRPHHKKNKKGMQFQASKDKPHSALLNKDNKLIGSENERRIKEGLSNSCGGKHPIEKCFKRPQNKPGLSRGFPSKQQNP